MPDETLDVPRGKKELFLGIRVFVVACCKEVHAVCGGGTWSGNVLCVHVCMTKHVC